MGALSSGRIAKLLQRGDQASTAVEKGRVLEDLVCYLFENVPGIEMTTRNQHNVFDSEEIDVAFWNNKHVRGFPVQCDIILVECKNWSSPVGSVEVSWFLQKLRERGLPFGILVAANGVTGDAASLTAALHTINLALHEGRRLVVMTRCDMETISHTDDIVALVKRKICRLVVAGTID